jgi:putative phosphoribosyl transferase
VNTSASDFGATQSVTVRAGEAELSGLLSIPGGVTAIVLFAHGSGSGRHSPRNQFVARRLQAAGLGTLLIDLLTAAEERLDDVTGRLRFDIPFLARRVSDAVEWLAANPATTELRVGLFGASTGAGAALVAAARQPDRIGAVVSRGGRPDLAGDALGRTICPTLLIVGGNDGPVIEMNEDALTRLGTQDKELVVVPGAGHLFEEPGKLEEVARLAANWFTSRLDSGGRKQLD